MRHGRNQLEPAQNDSIDVRPENDRRASRRRHAARHLSDGERPESVAAWMRLSMNEVYELMGTMEIDG